MKLSSASTLLLAALLFSLPVMSADLNCFPASEGMVIDGNLSDWSNHPLTMLEDEKLSVGLRHDSTHLYVLVMAREQAQIRSLQHGGVKVWFDIDKKENKSFGLYYVGDVELSDSAFAGRTPSDREMPEGIQSKMAEREAMKGMVSVTVNEKSTLVPDDGSSGPEAAAAFTNGLFCYEMRIPYTFSESAKFALGTEPDREIGVGFEFAGVMQRPDGASGGPPGGGGGRGGGMGGGRGGGQGGGGGGGGRGGGGGGGDKGEQAQMKQPQSIEKWFKAKPVDGDDGQ